MHYTVILRILGLLLMLFSISMLPSALISVIYADSSWIVFVQSFGFTLLTGFIIWYPVHRARGELRSRDGFLITVLFWLVLGLFGSIPFALLDGLQLDFTDAVFESFSGLTTTGATVITQLDDLPKSILFYRQQLQWFGGMGIIVLAIAVLPMLGIGGMQLYRAEAPGPVKDSKLTPRLAETAKALWYIYLALTIACATAYWLSGMSLFDAICHSFTTVAIGGFSTHDASIGYFDSRAIELVAAFFMLISGLNFALHFSAWREKKISHYWKDPEAKVYLLILAGAILFCCLFLTFNRGAYEGSIWITGAFEVISIATTTGFSASGYSNWPNLLPFMLLWLAFAGACAGSTGGGMKIIRVILLWKQGVREIHRLIHPNGVFIVKLGRTLVPPNVTEAVWGFCTVYAVTFVAMLMAMLATGVDMITAFSAVGACINNLGPGLGDVAMHYAELNDVAKWICTFCMLLGRLEIFTLLVLLSPMFWRR
ncbi:MAG: TrkH family potassium uptake protein [Pseudomonadales bacterium]|nr:TrkH family potassium uptake protein [Pseudomonadales bacterium]